MSDSEDFWWPVIDVLLLPIRGWLWIRDHVLHPYEPEEMI